MANNNVTNSSDVAKPTSSLIGLNSNHLSDTNVSKTSASQTGSKSTDESIQIPVICGLPVPISSTVIARPMINNPVVSSLNQILEKNRSINNKSINNAENDNNQTINSLLAVLSASASSVSNPTVSSVSSSSLSQNVSMETTETPVVKSKRGRKSIDPLKSPSSSRISTSLPKSSTTSSKSNSKKGLAFFLFNISFKLLNYKV